MADQAPRVVLITGCSSGIGEATARELAARGWIVYATARRPETLASLEAEGCRTLALDVTDSDSMASAVEAIELEHGAVGALVNNAGYSQSGAVESVPIDQLRRQFETNVFGAIALTQLVLPAMRAAGTGRIVNISSMGARFTFPGGGAYHATKHALAALSDALRFEVAGFGIRVVLIEPGLIRTRFGETASRAIDAIEPDSGDYGSFNAVVAQTTREALSKGALARLGGPPEAVARTVVRALEARRPKARYLVTPSARVLVAQRAVSSDRMWDAVMRTQFPSPGAETAEGSGEGDGAKRPH